SLPNLPTATTSSYPLSLHDALPISRHSQLIPLEGDTYLCDTPGFTSLYMADMNKEELKEYFPEFFPYESACRFQGCVHVNEPDRSEEHTSELQSRFDLVCRLLLEKQ